MKLISVESSEQHCATPQIWSCVHHQQGSSQFLSLDITQTECQSSAEDLAELPNNISLLFFLGYILPGSEDHREKMPSMQSRSYPRSHVCSSLDCHSEILCLTVLAEAYQPFMQLQKRLSFEAGVQWHFAAEELVYTPVVNRHIYSARLFH